MTAVPLLHVCLLTQFACCHNVECVPVQERAIQQKCLEPFRARAIVTAHNATDFERWLQLGRKKDKPLEDYEVKHEVCTCFCVLC